MNTPCFKFLPSYSISFNCQMLANFSGVQFEQTVPKLKKIKSFSRVHVLHKTWNKAVLRGGRAATAKKWTKKRAASAELLPIFIDMFAPKWARGHHNLARFPSWDPCITPGYWPWYLNVLPTSGSLVRSLFYAFMPREGIYTCVFCPPSSPQRRKPGYAALLRIRGNYFRPYLSIPRVCHRGAAYQWKFSYNLRPRPNVGLFMRQTKLGELSSWKARRLTQLRSSEWVWVQHVLSVCFRAGITLLACRETKAEI